jgi:hypothetical protein
MRMGKVAERWLPEGAVSLDTSSQLIQAGFESPAAPVLYTMTRLVSALIIPGALFALASSLRRRCSKGCVGCGRSGSSARFRTRWICCWSASRRA